MHLLFHWCDMLNISPNWKLTVSVAHPNHHFCIFVHWFLCLSTSSSCLFGVLASFHLPPAPHFPSDPLHPDVPKLTDLSFQGVSDTTISLSWSPLNTTAITGYRITVVAAGESVPIFEDMVLPTTGQYTVYGLEPGIGYDISVTTITENGESEPTTVTQQTCKIHVSIEPRRFFFWSKFTCSYLKLH